MNYLPMAKRAGAEIFSHLEVKSFSKTGNGNYQIIFTNHNGLISKTETIEARYLILGAGSQGSTELLLRSLFENIALSKTIGSRLSANGDVLGMAYNGNAKTGIIGVGADATQESKPNGPGPALGSYINYRRIANSQNIEDQFLLIDGVIPSPLRDLVAKGIAGYALSSPKKFSKEQLARARKDLYSFSPDEDGALNHSMLYLACGHDSSGGRYYLPNKRDRVSARWPKMFTESIFEKINNEMKSYAEMLGAVYVANPRSTVFGKKLQATHPLGGSPMAADVDNGVVDHQGRVFDPSGGFHKNLFVVDASIIPRSLAAPPLITISALAERIADLLIHDLKNSNT
jgi:cholesterol oxidase